MEGIQKDVWQVATEHFEVVGLSEPDKIVLYCDGAKGTTGKGEYIFTYTITSSGNLTDHVDWRNKGLNRYN